MWCSWCSLSSERSCEPGLANQNNVFPRSWRLAEGWAFDPVKEKNSQWEFAEIHHREAEHLSFPVGQRYKDTWEDRNTKVAAVVATGSWRMESTGGRTEPREGKWVGSDGLLWMPRFNCLRLVLPQSLLWVSIFLCIMHAYTYGRMFMYFARLRWIFWHLKPEILSYLLNLLSSLCRWGNGSSKWMSNWISSGWKEAALDRNSYLYNKGETEALVKIIIKKQKKQYKCVLVSFKKAAI